MKKIFFILSIMVLSGCATSGEKDASKNIIKARCVIEYTIAKDGSVKDVRVVECEPKGKGFEEASIRSAKKNLKYKPKIVDGKAVEVPGVRYTFKYELEK